MPRKSDPSNPHVGRFHSGNPKDGKHYWLTPPELWEKVLSLLGVKSRDEVYDPCPCPRPDDYDGLVAEWGNKVYINPPFATTVERGKKVGMTAWVRKAIAEQEKGKDVLLVYPQHGWCHLLAKAGAEFISMGDVRWVATEDGTQATQGNSSPIMGFLLRGKRPA